MRNLIIALLLIAIGGQLIAQSKEAIKPVYCITTNVFSGLRKTQDINLNFHVLQGTNDFSIGLDYPFASRVTPANKIDTEVLAPDGLAFKLNLTWRKFFGSKSNRYYGLAELKYHNSDWIYTKMGIEIPITGGGFGFSFPPPKSGYRDRFNVSLQKFVPALGLGIQSNFAGPFFICCEIKAGYAFITQAKQQYLDRETSITSEQGKGFQLVLFPDGFAQQGTYALNVGSQNSFVAQMSVLVGYKF